MGKTRQEEIEKKKYFLHILLMMKSIYIRKISYKHLLHRVNINLLRKEIRTHFS